MPQDAGKTFKPEFNARLLAAVANGNLDGVRQALRDGADPAARDGQGRTGMHLAINSADYGAKGREMISIFLNRGIDINDPDGQGVTILHSAVQDENYNSTSKIQDLLNFGADREARDRQGRTPLHWAVQKGWESRNVKFLLDQGADVNARDEAGATPLHLAARRGYAPVLTTLTGAGADLQAEDRNGAKVWDYAVVGGQDYQAQLLKAEAAKLERAAAKKREETRKAAEEQSRRAAVDKPPEKPRDPWTLLGPAKVAFVTPADAIGYRLTEVFNFQARTYTQITHNISTKSDAVAVKTFDEFDDKALFERAFNELQRLGGHADRTVINSAVIEKPSKPPKLQLPGAPPKS